MPTIKRTYKCTECMSIVEGNPNNECTFTTVIHCGDDCELTDHLPNCPFFVEPVWVKIKENE